MLLLRYEDLLIEPIQHFSQLAAFLDLPIDDELIKQAVENTSFEKLKAKEEDEGGFHERPDGCERFFRSGRSGEGHEQLTPDQKERMEAGFKDVLQRFGYQ